MLHGLSISSRYCSWKLLTASSVSSSNMPVAGNSIVRCSAKKICNFFTSVESLFLPRRINDFRYGAQVGNAPHTRGCARLEIFKSTLALGDMYTLLVL